MRNTFRNFLIEKGNIKPPSNDDGGNYDEGDDYDRHIDEWQNAFTNATQSIPFAHNTAKGTHKWKSLRHALHAHSSESAHADLLGDAPQELGDTGHYLRNLGKQLGYGNAAMELMLTPHVVSAVKIAQSKLSPDNPYKSIPAEDIAEREFEKNNAVARMSIAVMSKKSGRTPEEFITHVAPHIESMLNHHGPHGFMLAGGHYGLTGVEGMKPEFFPKWGPPENN